MQRETILMWPIIYQETVTIMTEILQLKHIEVQKKPWLPDYKFD